MLIDIITGSRGDILRVASLLDAIQQEQRKGVRLGYRFIYAGSDIDINLDKELFSQLQISRPNIYLDVAKDSNTTMAASAMVRYEKVISTNKPDLALVTGRTSSALACAYVAKTNLNIQLGYLNSGTSDSYNPGTEQINSKVLEAIADYHFTGSHNANQLLRYAGVSEDKLFIAGNTIADIVIKAGNKLLEPPLWKDLNLHQKQYVLLILDNNPVHVAAYMKAMMVYVQKTYGDIPVIAIGGAEIDAIIEAQGIQAQNLHMVRRMGFLQLGFLLFNARLVITNSTTITEQCVMYKDIDIIDLSGQTDWLAESYSNADITQMFSVIRKNVIRTGNIPYMWDGKSAERIIAVLKRLSMTLTDT